MTKRKHSAVVKAAKTGFQMDSIHTDNSETKEIATITSTGSLEHVGQLDGCIASSADNEGTGLSDSQA